MKSRATIAAFDFDGTITKGDTFLQFIRFAKGTRRFYAGFVLHLPLYAISLIKFYPKWRLKQRLFSYFFKGMHIDDFNATCERFSCTSENLINPVALKAIDHHRKNEHQVVVVSASIENWIAPIMLKLGIEKVIATKIEIDKEGKITGRFLTPNCKGKEKVIRLLREFPNRNTYNLYAYGDSNGDKELLSLADYKYFKIF